MFVLKQQSTFLCELTISEENDCHLPNVFCHCHLHVHENTCHTLFSQLTLEQASLQNEQIIVLHSSEMLDHKLLVISSDITSTAWPFRMQIALNRLSDEEQILGLSVN